MRYPLRRRSPLFPSPVIMEAKKMDKEKAKKKRMVWHGFLSIANVIVFGMFLGLLITVWDSFIHRILVAIILVLIINGTRIGFLDYQIDKINKKV